MRKFVILIITSIYSIYLLPGQTIQVIDSEDLKPIKDVAVFNKSKTKFGYTDLAGEFRVDAFSASDNLNFQHPSYEGLALNMEQIKKMDFIIILQYKTFEIDEFVVSANRWDQNKDEVPNKITQINMPIIEFTNPQTAADLLAVSDEVYVQKSQLGGGSPMIRGFATHRILFVVDGVRMNNAIFREGNLQNIISLDPNIIESTEVIFGPGAIVYGSDAIGGVIDFHSKKALLSTNKKLNLKVNALARTSSANKEKTTHIDFNLGGIKIAFMAAYTFSEYDDLLMGTTGNTDYQRNEYQNWKDDTDNIALNTNPNRQVESGYYQHNLMAKLRFQPTDKLNVLFINHTGISSDVPRYDRLIQYKNSSLKYGDWYYGPQKWMMNNISVDWKPGYRIFDAVKIIAARQDFTESRHDRKFNSSLLRERYEEVIAYSLSADFEKEFGSNLLFYGLEAVRNNIESTGRGFDILSGDSYPVSTRYPDGDNIYQTLSAYTGIKLKLSEAVFLNGGARYNYTSLYSTFIDMSFFNFPFDEISLKNSSLTGSAGIVWQINDENNLTLNTSTGFRAPNLDDAAKVFDSEPGSVVVPNPELKPEYAYNIDIGLKQNLFEIIHLELTGFLTLLDNAMVRRDFVFAGNDSIMYENEMSKVISIINASSATIYGGHFSMQFSPVRNLRLKSNLNITKGVDIDGVPFRHVPPTYGSTHIIYENKKIKVDFYAKYNGEMAFEDMAPSEVDKPYMYSSDANGEPYSPSWYTINMKASYQIGNVALLNAGIENLFDNRYRPYASGIAAPGRNFILALRIKI